MNFFDQDNQHVGMQVNADQITITMLMSGEFLRELRRWITLMQDQGLPDDEQYQGLPDDEQYEEVLEALYLAVNETRIYVSRLKGPMSGARFSPSDRSLSRASHKWIACRNLEQEKKVIALLDESVTETKTH